MCYPQKKLARKTHPYPRPRGGPTQRARAMNDVTIDVPHVAPPAPMAPPARPPRKPFRVTLHSSHARLSSGREAVVIMRCIFAFITFCIVVGSQRTVRVELEEERPAGVSPPLPRSSHWI